MPPEVASAGHVHDGPEPEFHGGANLGESVGRFVGVLEMVGFLFILRRFQFGVIGFEVSEDKEAGEGGGEEYQNQSEGTHFSFSVSCTEKERERERERERKEK